MPAKIESTHQLIDRKLVVYRRPESEVWQCRYTVSGKKWHCKSTGERDLKDAIPKAHEIFIGARLLKERNLPVVSKKVSDIAKLAIQKMDDNLGYETGSDSFPQYKRINNDFIVPFLGKKHIDSITPKVMQEYDKWRTNKLGKPLAYSSVRKHNVVLNRIFTEAEERGYIHKTQIPYLETKGVKSKKYPEFEVVEINAILAHMPAWIVNTKHKKSFWRRHVVHDYVRVLIETGARPGKELLNLQWKNVRIKKVQIGGVATVRDAEASKRNANGDPEYADLDPIDGQYDEEGNCLSEPEWDVTVLLDVYGKTKDRTVNGFGMTFKVLNEIVKRNYTGDRVTTLEKLTESKNEDFVFRSYWNLNQDYREACECFNHMFDGFLDDHNLLKDPKTGRKRVFYSIRSTFTTQALNQDRLNSRDLSKQLGNSIVMIEKHYDRATGEAISDNVRARNAHSAFFSNAQIPDIYQSKKAKAVITT
jgi:integrase